MKLILTFDSDREYFSGETILGSLRIVTTNVPIPISSISISLIGIENFENRINTFLNKEMILPIQNVNSFLLELPDQLIPSKSSDRYHVSYLLVAKVTYQSSPLILSDFTQVLIRGSMWKQVNIPCEIKETVSSFSWKRITSFFRERLELQLDFESMYISIGKDVKIAWIVVNESGKVVSQLKLELVEITPLGERSICERFLGKSLQGEVSIYLSDDANESLHLTELSGGKVGELFPIHHQIVFSCYLDEERVEIKKKVILAKENTSIGWPSREETERFFVREILKDEDEEPRESVREGTLDTSISSEDEWGQKKRHREVYPFRNKKE